MPSKEQSLGSLPTASLVAGQQVLPQRGLLMAHCRIPGSFGHHNLDPGEVLGFLFVCF